MNIKLILASLAAGSVLLGCESAPDTTKAPDAQQIKSFKGTPLTPEQSAHFRNSIGGKGQQGPNTASPGAGQTSGN